MPCPCPSPLALAELEGPWPHASTMGQWAEPRQKTTTMYATRRQLCLPASPPSPSPHPTEGTWRQPCPPQLHWTSVSLPGASQQPQVPSLPRAPITRLSLNPQQGRPRSQLTQAHPSPSLLPGCVLHREGTHCSPHRVTVCAPVVDSSFSLACILPDSSPVLWSDLAPSSTLLVSKSTTI